MLITAHQVTVKHIEVAACRVDVTGMEDSMAGKITGPWQRHHIEHTAVVHADWENATGRLSAPPKETKHTGAFNRCMLTYHPLILVETSR